MTCGRCHFYAAAVGVIFQLGVPSAALSQEPFRTYGRSDQQVPGSITQAAASLNGAVQGFKVLSDTLSDVAVQAIVSSSLDKVQGLVARDLRSSGQGGALLLVEIARSQNEAAIRSVVGSGAQYLGVGTEPVAIAISHSFLPGLRPAPNEGSRVSAEESFFLWVTWSENRFNVTVVPPSPIWSEVALAHGDSYLRETLRLGLETPALSLAIHQAQKAQLVSNQRRRLQNLVADKVALEEALRHAEANLSATVEKERRISAVAKIISAATGVMSLVEQIGLFQSVVGNDVPPSIAQAATSGELLKSAAEMQNRIAAQIAELRRDVYRADRKSRELHREIKVFMKEIRYPVNAVPQLIIP